MEQLMLNEMAEVFEDVSLANKNTNMPKDPAMMSKKEFLRSRQRPRATHGKMGKKRKQQVAVADVSARIAGHQTLARNVTPVDSFGNPQKL
jgi:hypothetical protein